MGEPLGEQPRCLRFLSGREGGVGLRNSQPCCADSSKRTQVTRYRRVSIIGRRRLARYSPAEVYLRQSRSYTAFRDPIRGTDRLNSPGLWPVHCRNARTKLASLRNPATEAICFNDRSVRVNCWIASSSLTSFFSFCSVEPSSFLRQMAAKAAGGKVER